LIIAHNPLNRELLTQLTQSWGLISLSVDTETLALETLSKTTDIELIILEQKMPNVDGLILAQQIRLFPHCQTIPLIIFTSLNLESNNLNIPLSTFLPYPIKKSSLYDGIIELFWEKAEKENQPLSPSSSPQWQSYRSNSNSSSQKDQSVNLSHLRVLLAEDNRINQQVAVLMLKKFGVRPDVVGNGLEAVEALRQIPYDIILMDVEMPEMDGLTATQEIRKLSNSPTNPYIIAITAYAMSGDREKCLQGGMNDYVAKPIREQELIRALESAVQNIGLNSMFKLENNPNTPESTLTEEYILDMKILDSIRDLVGEEFLEFFADLIQQYFDNSPKLLENIKTGISTENTELLRSASHTLGSSSATIGAVNFGAKCKELENLARSGTIEGAKEKFNELEREYQKVVFALKKLMIT
jgi:CheY-like chemotaxis protein/HPt (histidine-containing phosphotransfer) domain-containing protein